MLTPIYPQFLSRWGRSDMAKPRLPRRRMPPGTRVHTDKKKQQSKEQCRWQGFCNPPNACETCPENGMCLHRDESHLMF
jgi:hypothetical protein